MKYLFISSSKKLNWGCGHFEKEHYAKVLFFFPSILINFYFRISVTIATENMEEIKNHGIVNIPSYTLMVFAKIAILTNIIR